MMGHLKESLQEIVHTREGAWVAMICLSIAAPKDRKNIIKAFKPFLVKIASDEYGYLVLLRLLDVTDDTVLDRIPLLGKDVDGEEALQAIEDCIADQIPEVIGIESGSIDMNYASRVATVSLVIYAENNVQVSLTTNISTNV